MPGALDLIGIVREIKGRKTGIRRETDLARLLLDSAVERAQKAQKERDSGQTSLFSLLGGGGSGRAACR